MSHPPNTAVVTATGTYAVWRPSGVCECGRAWTVAYQQPDGRLLCGPCHRATLATLATLATETTEEDQP